MVSPPDVVNATPSPLAHWRRALPFALSFTLIPLALIAAAVGGWGILLLMLAAWALPAVLDLILGPNMRNEDPATAESDLKWFRLLGTIWVPMQFLLLFGLIAYVSNTTSLGLFEKVFLFMGVGAVTAVGIAHARNMIQRNGAQRWLGDILLSMVLYSHFRTRDLKVHNPHIGTPEDPATARLGEDFWAYATRLVPEGPRRAWDIEVEALKRAGLPPHSPKNPFWIYGGLCLGMCVLSMILGGAQGLLLFLVQAIVAVMQLELAGYVEHYGLTRRKLEDGSYEALQPHHSWNSALTASNWMLLNQQRHTDHHMSPGRPYPLLQHWDADKAPQLPQGYVVMAAMALVPKVWKDRMNPRVADWRRKYYPGITDWTGYAQPEPDQAAAAAAQASVLEALKKEPAN